MNFSQLLTAVRLQPQAVIIPAEWAAHKAIWTCWPSAADLWQEDLAPARAEVAAMIRALVAPTPEGKAGDLVHVLAYGDEALESARLSLPSHVQLHAYGFGDIWLRDTGSPFLSISNFKSMASFLLS